MELSPRVLNGRYANFSTATGKQCDTFIVGYEECAPDYEIERGGFPFWTLEFVVAGRGYYQDERHQRAIESGMLFAYGPRQYHRFGNDTGHPFRKYFLSSHSEAFPKAWAKAGLTPGQLFPMGTVVPLASIFDQMLDEGEQSDAQTETILAGLEKVLFSLIVRHTGTVRGDKSSSRKVYDLAMEIIQNEFRELHSLTDLAQRTGYSSEYLCRVFRMYHGQSPYQVLLHRKMSTAWLLLRDGKWQVNAVASELGFADPLHFSRLFRKIMRCSPSSVISRS